MLPYGLACLLVIYCNYTDLSTEWQNVQYPEMLHETSKCPLVVHRTKEDPSPVCSQTKLLDHSGRCMNSNRTDILGLIKRSCPEKRGRLFTLVRLLSSSVKIRTGSEPQSAKNTTTGPDFYFPQKIQAFALTCAGPDRSNRLTHTVGENVCRFRWALVLMER